MTELAGVTRNERSDSLASVASIMGVNLRLNSSETGNAKTPAKFPERRRQTKLNLFFFFLPTTLKNRKKPGNQQKKKKKNYTSNSNKANKASWTRANLFSRKGMDIAGNSQPRKTALIWKTSTRAGHSPFQLSETLCRNWFWRSSDCNKGHAARVK